MSMSPSWCCCPSSKAASSSSISAESPVAVSGKQVGHMDTSSAEWQYQNNCPHEYCKQASPQAHSTTCSICSGFPSYLCSASTGQAVPATIPQYPLTPARQTLIDTPDHPNLPSPPTPTSQMTQTRLFTWQQLGSQHDGQQCCIGLVDTTWVHHPVFKQWPQLVNQVLVLHIEDRELLQRIRPAGQSTARSVRIRA